MLGFGLAELVAVPVIVFFKLAVLYAFFKWFFGRTEKPRRVHRR